MAAGTTSALAVRRRRIVASPAGWLAPVIDRSWRLVDSICGPFAGNRAGPGGAPQAFTAIDLWADPV